VGRGDAGKMVENSRVSRRSAGVRVAGSDSVCVASTSLAGPERQLDQTGQDLGRAHWVEGNPSAGPGWAERPASETIAAAWP
jgi:hypothetical protein